MSVAMREQAEELGRTLRQYDAGGTGAALLEKAGGNESAGAAR